MKNTNKPYIIDNDLELNQSEINEIDNRFNELAQYFDGNLYDYPRNHIFTDILGLDNFLKNVEYESECIEFELSNGRVLYFCFETGD